MNPYPDSDPAAGPLPKGEGGSQDAPGSRQETSPTSPDSVKPPPSDQPGGTPHPPATAAGAAATAPRLLAQARSELQERRAGLLAEIAGLEQQRDRIRQEIAAHATGQSELIANRVKGFQSYLVGALQDLAAEEEQAELLVAPLVVQPSPLDQAATAAEAV